MARKEWYHRLKAMNICVTCENRKPEPGKVRCSVCLEKERRYNMRYFAERRLKRV